MTAHRSSFHCLRRSFLLLVCFVFFGAASAQEYSYLHYGIAEGLPSSEVYQCFQDKTGFIWFATDNGVARFDGSEMRTFHARQGLPDPVVFGFQEDVKGRLWFRSYSGRLSWFETDSIHRFAFNDTIAALCRKSILHSIYADSNGEVWLGAGEFMGRISTGGKISLDTFPHHQLYFTSIGSGFVFGLNWPSSLVNSVKIDGKEFPIVLSEHNYDNQTINAVRWNGDVYLSVTNSLFRYDGTKLDRVLTGYDHILSVSVDAQNRMWVGYRELGVRCYRDNTFKDPLILDFLTGKSVTKVMQDNQNGLWISTLQNGVYHVPNFSMRTFPLPSGAKIIAAKSIGNRTLLGDENGRLIWMNNQTFQPQRTTALPGKALFSIFIDSKKNIWASASKGSQLMDSVFSVKAKMQIQNDCFERHDTLFSLSRLRVSQYTLDGRRIKELAFSAIHRSMLDCPPYVLMSSRTGLDIFTSGFRFIRSLEAFKNFKISKLVELNDSVVFVATIGSGYLLLKRNSWDVIGESEGRAFVGENIYSVLAVDSLLWLGTEKGIAITPLKSLLKNQPDFIFLDHHSGIISDKINLLVATDSAVWAFSDRGMTLLPKNLRRLNFAPPKFYLKKTLVNNEPVNLRSADDLSFQRNNIVIDFGFINFSNQHVLIRSRLKSSSEWNYSENLYREYYALASGIYDFQLQYSSDLVHWTDALQHIPFTIAQPWWRTSWFQAIVIILIILILFAIFGSQLNILRNRNARLNELNESKKGLLHAEIETLERERARIAKDLHDGIGMNLTVLKLHLHALLKKYDAPDSRQVEDQLKATIEEIRSIVHDLTPSGISLFGLAESVKDYITRTTAHLSVNIELLSGGKKIMEPRISLFSFRILQELLSNSLKHSRASRIIIRINGFENSLNMIYQDNGIGFDPTTCRLGAGLMNIQSRLDAIQGTMEFTSAGGVLYIFNVPIGEEQGEDETKKSVHEKTGNNE